MSGEQSGIYVCKTVDMFALNIVVVVSCINSLISTATGCTALNLIKLINARDCGHSYRCYQFVRFEEQL